MSGEAQVVGSGPNGLVAALLLQRSGLQVTVHERAAQAGGGLRTEPLSRPGHRRDTCAAVLPLAAASPFFRTLDLGVTWLHPPAALAHPLDDGTAIMLWRDLRDTARQLGPEDSAAYERLLRPLAGAWDALIAEVLAPPHWPRSAALYARFARSAARSAAGLAASHFTAARARALFAGLAAHGTLPLDRPRSAAFGLVLALAAHTTGWPLVQGGAGALAAGLIAQLERAGGKLRLRSEPASLSDLHGAEAIVLDVAPRDFLRLAGARLPRRAAERLRRFPYGCGVHKVEWSLSQPVPWRAAECAAAGTVHLGGTLAEIAASVRAASSDRGATAPFVLFGQPTRFDVTRAPPGEHNAWAYCAVPLGSTGDYTAAIEAQVERFAPGFREIVLSRDVRTAALLEQHNPNLVGGSLAGAVHSVPRFFFGPFVSTSPYRTPLPRVYLCSAATPPGPGVHGMCGYHAARRVLRDLGRGDVGLYLSGLPSIL